MNELKNLDKEKWVNVEVRNKASRIVYKADITKLDNDDVLHWNVALMVLNPDSLYHGGYFKAKMSFPKNYPYSPPGTITPLQQSWGAQSDFGS